MVTIDRLFLVKCLHFFEVTDKVREEFSSGMSLLEVNRLLESFKQDLSDWPFTDLKDLGVESEPQEREARAVSDFERGHVLADGISKALEKGMTDPKEWLKACIAAHPDTVYGPPMAFVREGVAAELNVPPEILRRNSDAKDDVSAQGENVPPRRTVQLDQSDTGGRITSS